MRPRLQSDIDRQHGAFTRVQALAAGYTDREIKANTRPAGPWRLIHSGVYVTEDHLDELEASQRWQLRDRAALIQARRPAVLSHGSAARLLGLRTLRVEVPGTHLTHRGGRGTRKSGTVTRHRDLLPLCTEWHDGLPATSHARTALDLGRLHGYTHALVAIDGALNSGVPRVDFEVELARMHTHPHIARARSALDASDAGSESALETLARDFLIELDLGVVETQFGVRLMDGRVVWCDIRIGCHIFECHGFIKMLPPEEGGVARDSAPNVLRDQRARETALRAVGLGVSTIVWEDLFGHGRQIARARLRREYAVTATRFGETLPEHLRRFADAHPRPLGTLWRPSDLDRAA
ncbi:MAG: hypothetical protein V9G04_12040 [Nocardioides sp.]|jgi:hypothetical protein